MVDISNAYTGEIITHSDGVGYEVIDTSKLDFEIPEVKFGKKTKPTQVRVAKPGEVITTVFNGVEENDAFTAAGGELIFINHLSSGLNAFVPRDGNNVPNGREVLERGYELIGGDIEGEGAFYRPVSQPVKLLHEAIERPSVLKDAWGAGNHQFLTQGATLKSDRGRVTGIDKSAFDETWSITEPTGRIISEETNRTASR